VVCAAKNAKFIQNGKEINLPKKLKSGESKSWEGVKFTNEYYAPLTVTAWHPSKNN